MKSIFNKALVLAFIVCGFVKASESPVFKPASPESLLLIDKDAYEMHKQLRKASRRQDQLQKMQDVRMRSSNAAYSFKQASEGLKKEERQTHLERLGNKTQLSAVAEDSVYVPGLAGLRHVFAESADIERSEREAHAILQESLRDRFSPKPREVFPAEEPTSKLARVKMLAQRAGSAVQAQATRLMSFVKNNKVESIKRAIAAVAFGYVAYKGVRYAYNAMVNKLASKKPAKKPARPTQSPNRRGKIVVACVVRNLVAGKSR